MHELTRTLIPANKHDHAAVARAMAADMSELRGIWPDLLEWVQDRNWPIFHGMAAVLRRAGPEIGPYIGAILISDDAEWKANVLTEVAPALDVEAWSVFLDHARRIANDPTEAEAEEGADIDADAAISVYHKFRVPEAGRQG